MTRAVSKIGTMSIGKFPTLAEVNKADAEQLARRAVVCGFLNMAERGESNPRTGFSQYNGLANLPTL